MPHADFVHLRTHSAYSLSEGAIKADKIAALASEAAMPAVAITDSGNLFGALEFSQACTARGVQPIIGCQIGLAARKSASRARSGGAARARCGRPCQPSVPVLPRLSGDRVRRAATAAP